MDTSIRNTFISTVDHLPSDVIRSLWVIQSCNITVDKLDNQINETLTQLQQGKQPKQAAAQNLIAIRRAMDRYSAESVLEASALYSQLVAHRHELEDEIEQLQGGPHQPQQEQDLREQLIKHYREHPLASQKDAEREKAQAKSGLKLVLKIKRKRGRPRKDKVDIPKENGDSKAAVEPEEVYCFCKQGSFGNMIACDFPRCKNGEWFHYKCVGLLRSLQIGSKWFCSSECKEGYKRRRR